MLTPYFSTYLLPTALDMPTEIVPVILELADPNGPYGARGVAEMPLVPFAPAVAAAIHDATGVWLTQPADDAGAGSHSHHHPIGWCTCNLRDIRVIMKVPTTPSRPGCEETSGGRSGNAAHNGW